MPIYANMIMISSNYRSNTIPRRAVDVFVVHASRKFVVIGVEVLNFSEGVIVKDGEDSLNGIHDRPAVRKRQICPTESFLRINILLG